jgi:hypothetical protein
MGSEMSAYRPELKNIPTRLRRLPVARGFPVPWFVEWINGEPEFRVMSGAKFKTAIEERRCWVCGGLLGKHLAFVIGPMCAINKTSAEPPSHMECALWSAQFCPFLSRPKMVRREDETVNNALLGTSGLARNPGCAGVWVTNGYTLFKAPPGASATGYLIEMGSPTSVAWFAEGRHATRAEVEASIAGGMPVLEAMCETEDTPDERARARAELAQMAAAAAKLLP